MDPTPERPGQTDSRRWPRRRGLASAHDLHVLCSACGLNWDVDPALGGFRLRCECGGWVRVPGPARQALAAAPPPAETPRLASHDDQGRLLRAVPADATRGSRVPTSLPMAPGTLVEGDAATRARWTDRAIVELCLVIAALIGPALAVMLVREGREDTLLLPFASLVSGALVLTIVAAAGRFGTTGLQPARARHVAEGAGAAVLGFAIALAWIELLSVVAPAWSDDPTCQSLLRALGPGWAIFVLAISPALLEELAFRGLLQGRLMALLGARNGLVVGAAAFAICHGPTAALPLHFGLGLYLGWLRERSGSLLPGMLTHFGYNALIVLAAG